MDNKIFNVNGRSYEQFKRTINLILIDEYTITPRVWGIIGSGIRGYKINKNKGIILYWHLEKEEDIFPIENLITNEIVEKYSLSKALRKFKLDQLNNDIKKRLSIPEEILIPILWEWVMNYDGEIVYDEDGWEQDLQHDGSNNKGFRVYVEDWGKISTGRYTSETYSSFAVKPVYCWYGK